MPADSLPVLSLQQARKLHLAAQGLPHPALRGRLQASHTTVLSPFDPLVWDRERASRMFGFDYRIACYTPQERRIFGYFVLPLLHCGQLVGRLDAKMYREQAVFEIKALFLESGVGADDALHQALAGAVSRCAVWHGATRVRLVRTSPTLLAPRLRQALRRREQEDA